MNIDMSKPFAVIRKGGSIGESKGKYFHQGLPVVATFDSWEAAEEMAIQRNKMLSPGEKQYYKIKYIAVNRERHDE